MRRAYRTQKNRAGGRWHSYVATVDRAGRWWPVVDDDGDGVVEGASVQKLAVATAVLDKVDRGELRLGDRLDLRPDLIRGGSGLYHLQTVWGDDLTLANVLVALLLVSDNTAVRLCGRVVPAPELNGILAAKGLVHTRVGPASAPDQFRLGTTTPRETTDLLTRLAAGTLLSPASCGFLLGVTRSTSGYHDGVRRTMSSAERARIATKYGADEDRRHEAGLIFDRAGAPALVYGFFADRLGDRDNYGATHPAVRAHAALGRTMLDVVDAPTKER